MADEDVERLARGGFTEPRLEVIQKFSDGLNTGIIHKLRLGEKTGNAGEVKLITNSGKAEITGQFNEGIDGAANGVVGASLGVNANFKGVGAAIDGFTLNLSDFIILPFREGINIHAVTGVGRYAAGGSVRLRDETGFFKAGHLCANGGGRNVKKLR